MKALVRVALACALGGAFALHASEAPIARLVSVEGNVLVSTESNIASAAEALRLYPGMRVLVTANSSATVEYSDGCRVRLAAGERVEVRERGCNARLVATTTLAPVIGKRP